MALQNSPGPKWYLRPQASSRPFRTADTLSSNVDYVSSRARNPDIALAIVQEGTSFNVSKFSKKFNNEIIANFILKFF